MINETDKKGIVVKILSCIEKEDRILFAYLLSSKNSQNDAGEQGIYLGLYLSHFTLFDRVKGYSKKIAFNLENQLHTTVKIRILNNIDSIRLYQIIADADFIISKNERKKIAFEARIFDEYYSFKAIIDEVKRILNKNVSY